mmetsp:Transcript_8429/g.27484  ORF Transcript_8429/g.27484 Transcript_8429/m.27484 type:complete len:292 (+) Transcript_8429:279-1154(+)
MSGASKRCPSFFTTAASSERKAWSSVEMYASSISMSSSTFACARVRAPPSISATSSRTRACSCGKRQSEGELSSRLARASSWSWTVAKQARHGWSSCRIGRCSGCCSMCSRSSMGGMGKERWLPSQSLAASTRYSSGKAAAEKGETSRSVPCSASNASLIRRPVLTSARFSTSAPTKSRQKEAISVCASAVLPASSAGTIGPSSARARSVSFVRTFISATMPGRCCLRCCSSTRDRKRERRGTPSRTRPAAPRAEYAACFPKYSRSTRNPSSTVSPCGPFASAGERFRTAK